MAKRPQPSISQTPPKDQPIMVHSHSRPAIIRAQVAAFQLAAELRFLLNHEPGYYYGLGVANQQTKSIESLLNRMEQSPNSD